MMEGCIYTVSAQPRLMEKPKDITEIYNLSVRADKNSCISNILVTVPVGLVNNFLIEAKLGSYIAFHKDFNPEELNMMLVPYSKLDFNP